MRRYVLSIWNNDGITPKLYVDASAATKDFCELHKEVDYDATLEDLKDGGWSAINEYNLIAILSCVEVY